MKKRLVSRSQNWLLSTILAPRLASSVVVAATMPGRSSQLSRSTKMRSVIPRNPGSEVSLFGSADRRRAVRVERLDGLQSPGLPLAAVGLGPRDRLPVRLKDQPSAGIGDFDPVSRRLVDVEEECTLDRMLVRPGLDEDAVL